MGCGQGNPESRPGEPRVQNFSSMAQVEVASHAASPSQLHVFGDPRLPAPGGPSTREHHGFGIIVPLAPRSIPGHRTLPQVLVSAMASGKQQPNGSVDQAQGIEVEPPSVKPSSSASKATGAPWCQDSPGPAPHTQPQLVAHPVQDQPRISNPNPTASLLPHLHPKPNGLTPPAASPSSPQLSAGCSSEPVRAGGQQPLLQGREEMCNHGTDPGPTGIFPCISRVRAANKATELSHVSPGHSPSTSPLTNIAHRANKS